MEGGGAITHTSTRVNVITILKRKKEKRRKKKKKKRGRIITAATAAISWNAAKLFSFFVT